MADARGNRFGTFGGERIAEPRNVGFGGPFPAIRQTGASSDRGMHIGIAGAVRIATNIENNKAAAARPDG